MSAASSPNGRAASSWSPTPPRWAGAFARICGLDRVDVLVTDSGLPADTAARLTDAGIKVHAV